MDSGLVTQLYDEKWVKEVKATARRIDDDAYPPINLLRRQELLTFWRIHRPVMWAMLGSAGISTDFATVCLARSFMQETAYLQAGMARTDAREQAEQECLLYEREVDEPIVRGLDGQLENIESE